MSCDQCLGLRRVFGERAARQQARRLRRRGPERTTRILLRVLVSEGVVGASLLDVGGGVGAIPNLLLAAGARSAILVEASPAFLAVASEEAERRGNAERIRLEQGDFVELAPTIPTADVVTLDRVICCYHDMPALVGASSQRAGRLYGLVYPRDTWWNRAGMSLVNLILRITRISYRVFVHPASEVERRIERSGLRRLFHRNAGMWQVAVYSRQERIDQREDLRESPESDG